jgi:anti-sigma factor RsiW
MTKLTDTTLVAYVDGELDSGACREVATALESDPEAREKVCRLRQAAVLVRAVFHRPPDEAVDAGMAAMIDRSPRRDYRKLGLAVAASVLIAAVGFGGGRITAARHAPPEYSFESRLLDEIADYHTMYAREDEHQVELTAARPDLIEEWLGSRLHRQLHIPDLSDRKLTFAGARLLVVDGAPVAELLYHWPGQPHQPLGLCVTFGDPGDEPIQADARDGVHQVLWRHRGYTYVLVGWSTQQLLNSIAAELMPELDRDFL